MKRISIIILIVSLLNIFICSNVTVGTVASKNFCEQVEDDFYFIHITDTHVMNKLFDRQGISKQRFVSVIENVTSFDKKPAFIVITGDLVEWGGSGLFGALNCKTFADCLYNKDGQLYADASCSIPVYTTPGNHDYCFNRNLENYNTYIDKNHNEDDNRYIVSYNSVSLFFMDSGPNYYSNLSILFEWHGEGLFSDDIEWLEDELSNCHSARKIILMHHPAVGEEDDLFIHNREKFVELCETYNVEVVLAGHTHDSRVYDCNLNEYKDLPLNCSLYPSLYVQTDDCKAGIHYRNVSVIGDDVWLEGCTEINFKTVVR